MNKQQITIITIITLLVFSIPAVLTAATNEPFPAGYSMANFGTILHGNRISGRQPWTPACFAKDTAKFSLSSSYINYYDAMDNLESSDFRQASLGGWINLKKVSIKGSGIFFNALGIYYEHKGYLSIGTSVIPYVNVSVELEAIKAGLVDDHDEYETLVSTGLSAWVPWSFASASFTCRNITVEDAAHPGFRQPVALCFGIHTMPHRLGSQGILLTLEPESKTEIRLCIGEEFYVHRTIGLCFAVSTKPLMVSFGIKFGLPTYGVYTAFVNHPVLGWSQGIGMEYIKR
jgi:hypothetical protein